MYSPKKFFPALQSTGRGVLLVALVNVTLLAQTAPNPQDTVDLSSPAFSFHANLPRYFRSGPPLAQELSEARVGAALKGIPWKGLHFIVNDADNLSGFTKAGASALYRKLTCQSDVIALGYTTASASHLSAWGVVYTDYNFVIKALLKDNQKVPISSKRSIVVTRPGGSLLTQNNPVTFEFQGFSELQPSATYLQFLKYIPESSAYQTLDAYSTLATMGSDWVVARKSSAVVLPELPIGTLEASIEKWLTSCIK